MFDGAPRLASHAAWSKTKHARMFHAVTVAVHGTTTREVSVSNAVATRVKLLSGMGPNSSFAQN
jgi:hypothetical protein